MRTTKTPSHVLFVGLCLALGCGGASESDTDPTNADDDDDDDSGDDKKSAAEGG